MTVSYTSSFMFARTEEKGKIITVVSMKIFVIKQKVS